MTFPVKQQRPRKYTRGAIITSLEEFIEVTASRGWVFFGNSTKATHWGWATNQSFSSLRRQVLGGQVRRAVRSDAFPYVFRVLYLATTHTAKTKRLYQATCDELPTEFCVEAKSLPKLIEAVRLKCDFSMSDHLEFTLPIWRDHPAVK